MANFDVNVSTEPMARTMDGVTKSVQVVGGAVSAMQVAVIASEKAAADKICRSVDTGFYTLIKSRMSQRLSQFQSTMRSRVGAMLETSMAIDRVRTQMTGDFNRIKARYAKLFSGLDRTLDERVRAIDSDAMELSKKRTSILLDRHCQEAPVAMYCMTDTTNVALKSTAARVKVRTAESIDDLSNGARLVVRHQRTLDSIAEDGVAAQDALFFMPVVYVASESMSVPDAYSFEAYAPQAVDVSTRNAIVLRMREAGAELGNDLVAYGTQIRHEYEHMVSCSGVDPRVAQTMLGLFDASRPGALATAISQENGSRA